MHQHIYSSEHTIRPISDIDILIEKKEGSFDLAMSNSFGLGGTNASLVFKRYH